MMTLETDTQEVIIIIIIIIIIVSKLLAIQMALYKKYDKMGTDGLLSAATK